MTRRHITAALIGAMLVALTGCTGQIAAVKLTPKVSPPTIAKAGVLRAAVDLSYPPFAGTVKGQLVGLDVDVASAIAEQLGLKLELVDAKPAAAAAMLTSDSVDVALGGLTIDSAVSSQIAFAGTYVSDAPAIFVATVATGSASATGSVSTTGAAPATAAAAPSPPLPLPSQSPTATLQGLEGRRIAVQGGSLAYWVLLDTYGEEQLSVVATLDEALRAVADGKADVAAGDALVGTYMLSSFPTVRYAGQIGSAYPLGVGVSQAKPQFEARVRTILDKLSSEGVLVTLRRKWFGDLGVLAVTSSSQPSTAATTTTP
jgi:polar amino acid transport system substrate-binding protein